MFPKNEWLKKLPLLQERFPDPKSLADYLHETGFKAIWMLDPGIKNEKGYFVYDSGSERDIWIQTADGKPFVGTQFFNPFQLQDDCLWYYGSESKLSFWATDLFFLIIIMQVLLK